MPFVRCSGALGSIYLFLGVALGAFAAHGLEGRLEPSQLETWSTGVQYQLVHGLGLLAVSWLASLRDSRALRFAGLAFALGVPLFSASLYGLALGGPRWLGPVTPFGGTAFLAGWLALAWAFWTLPRDG